MTTTRPRFWTDDDRKHYRTASDRATRETARRLDGEPVAERLDDLWSSLADDQRAFLELLVRTGRRTVIARFEDDLFNGLAAVGLLQPPPGVGTLLMQDLQTAHRVPVAVWRKLTGGRDRYFPSGGADDGERTGRLRRRFGDRIEALVGEAAAAGDP